MNIHLLGTSKGGRPTNTEYQLSQIRAEHPALNKYQIVRAESNAKALQALLKSHSRDRDITLAPFYNVHGKGVRDTMEMITKNYTRLRLLHTSRLSVDYILAHRKGTELANMLYIATHDQAILQTRPGWHGHGLPRNLTPVGENNTAAGLDFLLGDDPRKSNTIAISTPWQWRDRDSEELQKLTGFGPANNHTYFGLFGLTDSDTGLSLTENIENPENIQFGVIELDDIQGSLANALDSISAEGKNIYSIMSFLQASGKVLFVIAYNERGGIDESSPVASSGSIREMSFNNEIIPYKYRLSIPNNRGSLGRGLGSISHLINIRSIESIGTSRDNADFEIIVARGRESSQDTLSSLETRLTQVNFSSQSSSGAKSDHILHTLRN